MNHATRTTTDPKPVAAYLGNIVNQPPAEPAQIKSMTLNIDRARFTFTNGRHITTKYNELDNPTREVMLSFLLATLKTLTATMPRPQP